MKLSINFEQGPWSVEIEASEDEDYSAVISELKELFEEYEVQEQDAHISKNEEKAESKGLPGSEDAKSLEEFAPEGIDGSNFKECVNKSGLNPEDFLKLFEIERDRNPRIIGGNEVIEGSTNSEKMEKGALVLLTIWDELYGESWVKTSTLKDALRDSGLPYDRFDSVYNRSDFNRNFSREGRGRGAKLKITRVGKDEAFELMREISQKDSGTD